MANLPKDELKELIESMVEKIIDKYSPPFYSLENLDGIFKIIEKQKKEEELYLLKDEDLHLEI